MTGKATDPQPAADPARGGWFKAHASTCNGACLEVAEEPHQVRLRDSKQSGSGYPDIITVSPLGWMSFLQSLSEGPVHDTLELDIERHGDGGVSIISRINSTELVFTEIEWTSFLDGVNKREFGRPYSRRLSESAA